MKENKFPVILRELRKKHKHTQMDLANLLEVRKTTVSNYETGYSAPDMKTILKISKIYNVSLDDLLGHDFIGAKQPPVSDDVELEEIRPVHKLFVVNDIKNIENRSDSQVLYCISIPTEVNSQSEYVGVKIVGNSMNKARIHDGDIVIIQLQASIENGDIAVVCINEKEYAVGKFYNNENGYILLTPVSFDEYYMPMMINITEDSFRIVGKVVHAIINL